MDKSLKHCNIDESKRDVILHIIEKSVWCDDEEPVITLQAKYKLAKKEKSGIITLTRGALYIFKKKLSEKKGVAEPKYIFCPLEMIRLVYAPGQLTIETLKSTLVISTDDADKLTRAIVMFHREATFGVKPGEELARKLVLEGPTERLGIHEVTSRPDKVLTKRGLMLIHHYKTKGQHESPFEYLERRRARQQEKLTLGPSCDPGEYVEAFAHAIAWENNLLTLSLQTFVCRRFGKFLAILMEHSQTIRRLVFQRYKAKQAMMFNHFQPPAKSVVREWVFMADNTDGAEILFNWLENANKMPAGSVEELVMKIPFMADDTEKIIECVNNSPALKTVQSLFLQGDSSSKLGHIARLFGAFDQLESVNMRGFCMDGSQVLQKLCEMDKPPSAITLTSMRFETKIGVSRPLPPNLRRLTLTHGAYPIALAVMAWLTSKPVDIPVILELNNSFSPKSAELVAPFLTKMAMCMNYPTLVEINWSNNFVPSKSISQLFAFFYTQKRLRLLSLSGVNTDNQQSLLLHILQLAVALPLYGLDLSNVDFERSLMVQFIRALAQVTTHLRRLDLSGAKAGDEGLRAMIDVISVNRELAEIGADGFEPRSSDVLFQFWSQVAGHPTIQGNDFPFEDLQSLRLTMDKLPPEARSSLEIVHARPELTSTLCRELCFQRTLKMGGHPDFSPAIFGQASPWQKEMQPIRFMKTSSSKVERPETTDNDGED